MSTGDVCRSTLQINATAQPHDNFIPDGIVLPGVIVLSINAKKRVSSPARASKAPESRNMLYHESSQQLTQP